MKRLTLNRTWFYPNQTLGTLYHDGKLLAYTLERPWKDNKRSESCIPIGLYHCVWQLSPKFGWTYQVLDVPDRSRILIHAGNIVRNTYGCILVGKRIGRMHGEPAVLLSRPTLTNLHSYLAQEPFDLHIRGEYYDW